MFQRVPQLEPALRIFVEEFRKEITRLSGRFPAVLARNGKSERRLSQDLPRLALVGVRARREGKRAGQHDEGDNAERPRVGLECVEGRVGELGFEHFGRAVAERAHDLVALARRTRRKHRRDDGNVVRRSKRRRRRKKAITNTV